MWATLKEWRQRRTSARQARKLRKLRMEAMEPRICLAATFGWTGEGGNGLWSNPVNWGSTVAYPGSSTKATPPRCWHYRMARGRMMTTQESGI